MKKKKELIEKVKEFVGIKIKIEDDYLILNNHVIDVHNKDIEEILEIVNDYLDHLRTIMSVDD